MQLVASLNFFSTRLYCYHPTRQVSLDKCTTRVAKIIIMQLVELTTISKLCGKYVVNIDHLY